MCIQPKINLSSTKNLTQNQCFVLFLLVTTLLEGFLRPSRIAKYELINNTCLNNKASVSLGATPTLKQ